MAGPYYVDSAASGGSNTGVDWTNAFLTLGQAAAVDVAGDIVNVEMGHLETGLVANPNYNWAGTAANPVRIFCKNKSTGADATGARIGTASAIPLTFASAGGVYVRGLTLASGAGTSSNANLVLNGSAVNPCKYESCALQLDNSGAASGLNLATTGSLTELDNCSLKFGNVLQRIAVNAYGARLILRGGSIDGTGSAITGLFNVTAGSRIEAIGFDASAAAASMSITASTSPNVLIDMVRCALPGSWSGYPNSSTGGVDTRIRLIQCGSAGVITGLDIMDGAGRIRDNEAVYMTGGVTDGTTPLSLKLESNSQASFPFMPLWSDWVEVWVDTTTSKTLTWNYVADTNDVSGRGAGTAYAFQNNEVYIEAIHFGSASSPIATLLSSAPSTPNATPTDNAGGAASWTTTPLVTPKIGCCTLNFATAMKGTILARLCVADPSKIIYGDPAPAYA